MGEFCPRNTSPSTRTQWHFRPTLSFGWPSANGAVKNSIFLKFPPMSTQRSLKLLNLLSKLMRTSQHLPGEVRSHGNHSFIYQAGTCIGQINVHKALLLHVSCCIATPVVPLRPLPEVLGPVACFHLLECRRLCSIASMMLWTSM